MNYPTEIFGGVVVAHTPEDVGDDQAIQLANWLQSLERNQVVVDLDGTESIDSEGLSMFLDVQEHLRANGGDLKIATTMTTNRKIFEITCLDQRLEVFDSVLDAVKSFV